MPDTVTGEPIHQKGSAEQLLAQAEAQDVCLVGPGGLLPGLTARVLESSKSFQLRTVGNHPRNDSGSRPLVFVTECTGLDLSRTDGYGRM